MDVVLNQIDIIGRNRTLLSAALYSSDNMWVVNALLNYAFPDGSGLKVIPDGKTVVECIYKRVGNALKEPHLVQLANRLELLTDQQQKYADEFLTTLCEALKPKRLSTKGKGKVLRKLRVKKGDDNHKEVVIDFKNKGFFLGEVNSLLELIHSYTPLYSCTSVL